MAEQAYWYVVHTYSGYENKVATDLMTMVENRRIQDLICDVKVPTETVMEDQFDKTGNKIGEKEVQRKIYPGYGFVGPASKPEPLSEEEVAKLGVDNGVAAPEVDYAVGDNVEITSGTMEGSIGTVEEINLDERKVRIKINMFGREIPAELGLHEVKLL